MTGRFMNYALHKIRGSAELMLLTLLAVSLAVNLIQSSRVMRLQAVVTSLKGQGQLAVGTVLPTLTGLDPQGQVMSVAYGPGVKPTIIYLFSPTCGWCTKNLANLKALTQATEGKYRTITVSLLPKGVPQYIKEQRLTMPVMTQVSDAVAAKYKFGGTPQTIVVSGDGRVIKVWSGAYTNQLQIDVEKFFGVELPGLPATNTQASR